MNGYELSHNYHDWAANNRTIVKPTVSALYFFLIETCNRLGWKKEFSISAKECMEMIGVSSYNTFKSAFDVLCEHGFVTVIKKACNHYQANIITLSNINKVNNRVSDKVADKVSTEYSESNCDIHKTIKTNETIKTNREGKSKRFTKPTIEEIKAFIEEESLNVDAEHFFNYYESNGWIVGRTPMKNWKATIRNWSKKEWNKSGNGFAANSKTTVTTKKRTFRDTISMDDDLGGDKEIDKKLQSQILNFANRNNP